MPQFRTGAFYCGMEKDRESDGPVNYSEGKYDSEAIPSARLLSARFHGTDESRVAVTRNNFNMIRIYESINCVGISIF